MLNLFFKLKGPPDRMSSGGGGTPGVRSEFPSLLRRKQAVVMSAGRAAAFPTASVAFQAAVIPPPPPRGPGETARNGTFGRPSALRSSEDGVGVGGGAELGLASIRHPHLVAVAAFVMYSGSKKNKKKMK